MTTTAAPDLDSAHWRYLAEGKLHVVVAFEDCGGGALESPAPSRFQHHALRLLKERHPDAAGVASALYDAARERAYLERVVGPTLGVQYVGLGWTVPVTRAFLEGVAARIAPARPPGRAKYGLDLGATTAECLRNLTQFFPPVPRGLAIASSGTLTLELKPKAGYASRSYLVAPEHRAIKHRLSRFQLMQRYKFQLKRTEAIEPEWGVLRGINTDYSPIVLFSGQPHRMAHALRCLLRNPQNFCQLFAGPDGTAQYGRGLEDPTAAYHAIARLLPTSTKQEEEGPFGALATLLARVLAQEPLLARLWALQAMDVLDVEGAGLVLDRLAALCGGDEEAALARLAGAELEPLVVADETRLRQLEGLLARPIERPDSDDGEAAWLARHAQAKAAVETLAEDDCVLLLRRWLVSLGACDASLMVSLRRCESENLDARQPQQQLQTAEAAGVLQWGSDVYIAYCAHVVDLGPKPPGKARSKAALEKDIVALAGRPLDDV